MYKIYFFFYCFSTCSLAIAVSDALVIGCRVEAEGIVAACIIIPPVTPEQEALCLELYTNYRACLVSLQEPLPLSVNKAGYISPYAESPYDICKWEVARLINDVVCF